MCARVRSFLDGLLSSIYVVSALPAVPICTSVASSSAQSCGRRVFTPLFSTCCSFIKQMLTKMSKKFGMTAKSPKVAEIDKA